jgi:hypothetical protein
VEYVVHASGPQLKIMLVTAVFEYKTVGFRNSDLCSETRLLCSEIRPWYSKNGKLHSETEMLHSETKQGQTLHEP